MSSTSAKQACCFRCDGPSPQIFCQECGLGYHSECAIDGCDGSGQDNQITPCSQCRSLRISTDKWRSFAAFSKEKLNQILFGLLTLPNNPSPKIMELDAEHLQLTTDKLGPKKFLSLQQVRKKAQAGFYTCPEELLLDLRTIRHFIGANCSVWIVRPVIDYIERIEQHLQMIDLCPHCTFHCLTSGSSWFIQSCPKPHQLVLAQYKAITWWPAKLLKYDPFNARVLVSFFGREHHCRWTSVSSCFLMIDPDLSVNYQERILIPPDMGEDFDEAVDEFLYHVEKLHQASVKPRFAQFMKRWSPCDGVFITESKTRRSQSQRDDNLVIIDPFDDDNPIPLEILLEMSSNVEKSVIGSKIVRENSATVSSNELITSNSVNNSHDSNSRDNNIDETMDVKHLHNTSVTGPDNSEKIFSDSSLNFDVDMNGSIQSNGMNTSKTNESHPVTSSGGERPPKNQFDPANFVIDSNHIQKIGGKPYQIYDPISKKSISPDEFNRFSTQHITGTEGAYVCAIPTHAGKSCQKETRTTKYKVKRHQMFSLPHRCVMCDKFFTGLLNLRSHMMSKHGLARKS